MQYVVLDLEWNQPLSARSTLRKPVYLQGEIVQIGAVKLDENFQVIDSFKIMISPKYYRKMHKRVTRLTQIKDADLQYGFPFRQSFQHFKHWCGSDFLFLTWGDNDIPMLHDNMRLYKLDTNWIPKSYNVQVLFDVQIAKENRQCSLSYALEKLDVSGYQAHDALNDALNTACVCGHLDMANGLDDYDTYVIWSRNANLLCKDAFPGTYLTKSAALEDDNMHLFACPICGETVYCKEWVTQNDQKKIAIAKCGNDEEFFVRLRFSKTINGMIRVSRMVYSLSEDNITYYQAKLAEQDRKLRDLALQTEIS